MFDKVIQFDPYNPDAYNNKGDYFSLIIGVTL